MVYSTATMKDPNKIIPGTVMDVVLSECDSAALLHKIKAVLWDSVTLMLLCFEGQSLKEILEGVADAVLIVKDKLNEAERLDNAAIDEPEEENHFELSPWNGSHVLLQASYLYY